MSRPRDDRRLEREHNDAIQKAMADLEASDAETLIRIRELTAGRECETCAAVFELADGALGGQL